MSEIIEAVKEEVLRIQESYMVITQTFAGLRLSRWQLTRLLASQIWRELSPTTAAFVVLLIVVLPLWILSSLLGRKKSAQSLGIPLLGKSKGRKMDFLQMMEDAAEKVCWPLVMRPVGADIIPYAVSQ